MPSMNCAFFEQSITSLTKALRVLAQLGLRRTTEVGMASTASPSSACRQLRLGQPELLDLLLEELNGWQDGDWTGFSGNV